MTNLIETVARAIYRARLVSLGIYPQGDPRIEEGVERCWPLVEGEARAIVAVLLDDNSLPLEVVPEGYWFHRLNHAPDFVNPDRSWECALQDRRNPRDFTVLWGYGPTPRAAVLDAIKQTGR